MMNVNGSTGQHARKQPTASNNRLPGAGQPPSIEQQQLIGRRYSRLEDARRAIVHQPELEVVYCPSLGQNHHLGTAVRVATTVATMPMTLAANLALTPLIFPAVMCLTPIDTSYSIARSRFCKVLWGGAGRHMTISRSGHPVGVALLAPLAVPLGALTALGYGPAAAVRLGKKAKEAVASTPGTYKIRRRRDLPQRESVVFEGAKPHRASGKKVRESWESHSDQSD
jgi:hypothetical protein